MKIYEGPKEKLLVSKDYNYKFNKLDGHFMRWGAKLKDDPDFSPYGPEIADIEISTVCSQKCKFCAPAGSKVLTPKGDTNIEEIEIDSIVYGLDQNQQRCEYQVEQLHEREYSGELICIETEAGDTLKLTPNHPIFVQEKGWIEASKILESDIIIVF